MHAADRVRQIIGDFLGTPVQDLPADARLADVVGESFLLVELVIQLEEELDARLRPQDLRGLVTVTDLVERCLARLGPERLAGADG